MIKPSEENILTVCNFWAGRLKYLDNNASIEELVNVSYAYCKTLTDERLLQKWAKYSIINYIIKFNKKDRAYKRELSYKQSNNLKKKEEIEEIRHILYLVKTQVKPRDYTIVMLHFYKGVKQKDIALLMNVSTQRVSQIVQYILELIRRHYYMRNLKT